MKKRYLFILIIFTLLITGCGNKNTLKCTTNKETDGVKVKEIVTIYFEKDTDKLLFVNMDSEYKFENEDDALAAAEMRESFCSDEVDAKSCEFDIDDNTLEIKVRELKDSTFNDLTKEEIKESFEKNKETTCK